jgi:hypothetical protein
MKKGGTLINKLFSAKGYAEIYIQRQKFTIKRHIKKLCIENPK